MELLRAQRQPTRQEFVMGRTTPTVAMSMVMATGILISGACQQVPWLRDHAAPEATGFLLLLWLLFAGGYVRDAWSGGFFAQHVKDPISSFGVGTWVAGTSMAAVCLVDEFPALRPLSYVLFGLGVAVWAAYMFLVGRNYVRLWTHPERTGEIHGVVLLACVATQSLLFASVVLWGKEVPHEVSVAGLLTGGVFYAIGFLWIVFRYVRTGFGNLANSWTNTNCILHGAMSSTGVVAVKSQALPLDVIVGIWVWVVVWFVVVETFEILRAVQRVRLYGVQQGLFAYSEGQWARNFTFGMGLLFTKSVPLVDHPHWQSVRENIVTVGTYVVLCLFLFELMLAVRFYVAKFKPKSAQKTTCA